MKAKEQMKKLSMLALGGILLVPLPLAAARVETVDGYSWSYRINGNTTEIYSELGAAVNPKPTGAVTIPSWLGGKRVTSIGSGAFYNCKDMTSVTIPASVKKIDDDSFGYCSGLESVIFKGNAPKLGGKYVFHRGGTNACPAYVRKGSTGWGVEIPGTWNIWLDLNYIPDAVEEAPL